jgi:hypothetical protein
MSQEEKTGMSPQTADEMVAEMMAQAAAQAKRRTDTQDAAKRIVQLSAEIRKNRATVEAAWDRAKKNPDIKRSDFETTPAVLKIKSEIALAKGRVQSFKNGDGSPEYAAALEVALCFDEMRAEEEPADETVRQYVAEVAKLARLKVLDSQVAKKANGGKYPSGAAVYKEVCMVYVGEDRQSDASRGLVKEFRKLVDRHYDAEKATAEAEFAALEEDEDASDDLQAMAHGEVGKYRLYLPEYKGKKAGYAIVEVRFSRSGKLEVWAIDGAGSLASVKQYAEMRLSLPIQKQEEEEVIAGRYFGWVPNYMPPERRADADNFLRVLQISLRIFNENGREERMTAPTPEELAKIDADLEAVERHIAEGEKLLAEAEQANG